MVILFGGWGMNEERRFAIIICNYACKYQCNLLFFGPEKNTKKAGTYIPAFSLSFHVFVLKFLMRETSTFSTDNETIATGF